MKLSIDRKILDAMGKDAKEGGEVHAQWYNFARRQGATAEEAKWSERGNISMEHIREFLRVIKLGQEWPPPPLSLSKRKAKGGRKRAASPFKLDRA